MIPIRRSVQAALQWMVMLSGLIAAGRVGAQIAIPPDSSQLEEVVVTAQKRSERLLDVPQAVTAISADVLEEKHLHTMEDFVGSVPNMMLQTPNGQNAPIYSIRGVEMYDYSFNQGSPVAVYLDEVLKGNNAIYGFSMYDLERVEVLKGPQGTLYGKNTTGGAINFISRRPTLDAVGGDFDITYGNYSAVTANGALNLPISSTLGLRVAGFYDYAHGYMENVVADRPDLSGTGDYSFRASLLFKPSDSLEFLLRAQTSKMHTSQYGVKALVVPGLGIGAGVYSYYHAINPVANPYLEDFQTGLGKYQLASSLAGTRRNESDSVALTATWNATDSLTITSITSVDYGTFYSPEDTAASVREAFYNIYIDRDTQITQDLRLTTSSSGPFNYIVGLYFDSEAVYNSTIVDYFLDVNPSVDGASYPENCNQNQNGAVPSGQPVNCTYVNSFNQLKHSTAIYSDGTYQINPQWKAHLGLRYTYDTGEVYNYAANVWGGGEGVAFFGPNASSPRPIQNLIPGISKSFSGSFATGRAGIDYAPNTDTLVYGSYSHGYRGEAFNAQAFFTPASVNLAPAETNDAFEVGYKTQLLDHRLQVTSAVFWDWYKNLQNIAVNPANGIGQLRSLPKARIYGAELEFEAKPSERVTLSLGLGLLNAKIIEGLAGNGVTSVAGNNLANAPHASLNVGADLLVARGEWGRVNLRVDDTTYSPQYMETLNEPVLRTGTYSLLSARLYYKSADEHWGVGVWGKNLTGAYYRTSVSDNSGQGFYYQQFAPPRTYGVEANYKF